MNTNYRIPRCSTAYTVTEQAKRAKAYREQQLLQRAAKQVHAAKWERLRAERALEAAQQ